MQGKNWIISNIGKKAIKLFFDELVSEFPEIKDQVEQEDQDMFHFRMEHFAGYTIEQIKKKDTIELKRCFSFIELRIELMDSDLMDALNASYLESLLLGECAHEGEYFMMHMPKSLNQHCRTLGKLQGYS